MGAESLCTCTVEVESTADVTAYRRVRARVSEGPMSETDGTEIGAYWSGTAFVALYSVCILGRCIGWEIDFENVDDD